MIKKEKNRQTDARQKEEREKGRRRRDVVEKDDDDFPRGRFSSKKNVSFLLLFLIYIYI